MSSNRVKELIKISTNIQMITWYILKYFDEFHVLPEVRIGVDHVPDDDHDEVGVDISLVDLVNDHVTHAPESGL